jgi:hypothetical protein
MVGSWLAGWLLAAWWLGEVFLKLLLSLWDRSFLVFGSRILD